MSARMIAASLFCVRSNLSRLAVKTHLRNTASRMIARRDTERMSRYAPKTLTPFAVSREEEN